MPKSYISQNVRLASKFTQFNPATTIYWHTCKFTRKLFCSPICRVTYSPEGLRLKQAQDAEIKAAAKRVCKVYFYRCPITNRWFTTRKASSRYSPESKAIMHQSRLDYARQHRQEPAVKQRERLRMQTPQRKQYKREWDQKQKAKLAKGGAV